MVDRGLPAYRRIHLRQQRGGHLHERHAPHITGGGKARHITNHPAAQREQRSLAVALVAQQIGEDLVERLPGLVLLAIGQSAAQHPREMRLQTLLQPRCIKRGHRGVGHDQCRALGRGNRSESVGRTEQAAGDANVIRAGVERDANRGHVSILF